MADRLDDLICTFHPGASAMETLAILLLGWIIFGTILTVVGKFLYARLLLDAGPGKDDGGGTSLNSTAPPVSSAPPTPAAPEKPITNTERFISQLKSHPPPSMPTKLVRSKSTSSRSVDHHPDVSPVAGSNADCVKWVTNSLSYVYSRSNILTDLTTAWKDSLNALTKRSEIETGVSVEIQQILFQEDHPPRLNNVFCEITPNEKASITGDFESRFGLMVRARREQRDHQSISDYRLVVERLRGRLNVAADLRESATAHLKFDGWPEIRMTVANKEDPSQAPTSTNGGAANDEQLLLDIILEMVTSALRSATTQLQMGRYGDFPRFTPSVNPAEPILPVHYDSMLETRLRRSAKDKKLLVKVVKANNIGSQRGCHQLHTIIEMDDPPQRHQTTVKQGTENPFWDENFLFDLSPSTEEILFELYDRDSKGHSVFLGLGIVGMEELLMNPSQRQIIPLQSRPYENDPVSGTLTVEFLFIDGMDLPHNLPADVVAANKTTPSMDAEGRLVRRDSYHRATKRQSDLAMSTGMDGNKPASPTVGSFGHQRRPSPHRGMNTYGDREDSLRDSYYGETSSTPGMGSIASSLSSKEEDHTRTGRPRNKRNFFRTLKERLSRSKDRSRSVEPGAAGGRDDSLTRDGDPLMRSVSADRARSSQLLAVPGTSGAGSLADSARSSLSEVSVISNASTKTYLDEASSLVIESMENGIKKHYLIPMALAEKRKWKKKGTKLHIFSDHVFVAKHLTGGSPCQVCGAPLARRPGKQGYECRDCLLRCHKPCHVKVESLCPSSTVHFMELEFVEESAGLAAAGGTARVPRRL